MFISNNKLIQNISDEFKLTNKEVNDIIRNLFGNITLLILDEKRFYMEKLGVISIDKDLNVVFSNDDEDFDESLESIHGQNINIKDIFLEKSIYKSIFNNIKNIAKDENVIIENFGSFYDSDLKFDADQILKNVVAIRYDKYVYNKKSISNIDNDDLIKKLDTTFDSIQTKEDSIKIEKTSENNEIVEDILDEIDSKINNNKKYYHIYDDDIEEEDEEDIEEIIDNGINYIDNSILHNEKKDNVIKDNIIKNNDIEKEKIVENIWKNKTHNDINSIVENVIDKPNNEYKNNNIDLNDQINNDDKYDKEKNNLDNKINSNDYKNDNENLKDESSKEINYTSNKVFKELTSSNNDAEINKNNKEINKINNKRSKKASNNIFKIVSVILFILVIGIISSIYYYINKPAVNSSVENGKLYDIANTFFDDMKAVNLYYTTSKDMYYWEISKSLYGEASYWPLIYAYNSNKYKVSDIIKKGSSILYKSIPELNTINSIKYFNNTLSKSYISVYPLLVSNENFNHSLWALKFSAYYDINVFKNNKDIMPEKTYSDILENNNSMVNSYNEIVKHSTLNDNNIFLLFIESIKEDLGIK